MKGYYLRIKTKKDYQSSAEKKWKRLMKTLRFESHDTRTEKKWKKWVLNRDFLTTKRIARGVYRTVEEDLAKEQNRIRRIIRRPANRYCFNVVMQSKSSIRTYICKYLGLED